MRLAFLVLNSVCVIGFSVLILLIAIASMPFEALESEDRFLLKIWLGLGVLIPISGTANFYHFFKKQKPTAYLVVVPMISFSLVSLFSLLSLTAGLPSLEIFLLVILFMLPLGSVLLLKELAKDWFDPDDGSIFD